MTTVPAISTVPIGDGELVRITGEQFDQMVAAGVWGDKSPIELWDGFLRLRNCRDEGDPSIGHGPKHAAAVRRFARALARAGILSIQVQLPIKLDEFSRPEPDLCVLAPPLELYDNRQPEPRDIVLAVECASSSRKYDLGERKEGFAQAGIPTYVVVDVVNEVVHVFTSPDAAAAEYRSEGQFHDGDTFVLNLAQQGVVTLAASDLLP